MRNIILNVKENNCCIIDKKSLGVMGKWGKVQNAREIERR